MNRNLLPMAAVAIAALLASCSTLSGRSPGNGALHSASGAGVSTEASDGPLRIIDAHLHTRFKSARDREDFFAEMKANHVVGAVAHTGDNGTRGYEDLRDHGIIHCFGVGEKFGKREQDSLEDGLRSGKYSCIKIYLGYIPIYATDSYYSPAYRLAEKYGVPVVFHTGDTLDRDGKVKYSDPMQIDEIAVDHRKITFVIAHCGNPWIDTAAEIAYKNPNVYMDVSAFLIGDLENEPAEKLEEYVTKPVRWIFGYIEDPTKLIFGTDWPLTKMKPYIEAIQRAIPREHWRAVFHDNALRVFPKLREVERSGQ